MNVELITCINNKITWTNANNLDNIDQNAQILLYVGGKIKKVSVVQAKKYLEIYEVLIG